MLEIPSIHATIITDAAIHSEVMTGLLATRLIFSLEGGENEDFRDIRPLEHKNAVCRLQRQMADRNRIFSPASGCCHALYYRHQKPTQVPPIDFQPYTAPYTLLPNSSVLLLLFSFASSPCDSN